jgi:endonuclease/exonuclease/phosphatase family metal-dependent hydrolase
LNYIPCKKHLILAGDTVVPIVEALLILVMSFNVRYNNPGDGINSWDNRKDIVINLIEEYKPDLLGMQEVRGSQLNYLEEHLNQYGHIGRSRSEDLDDEQSPIFYNKNNFELIASNTYWLSETPDIPSKGWDAAFNRIVTWGKFKHKDTGKTFFHFNTHFDHIGQQARLNSVKLLKKKIAEIAENFDYIVTGDFNFDPSSESYKLLTEWDREGIILADVSQFSEATRAEITGTFNGFDFERTPTGPIDFILIKPTISVNYYNVVDTLINGKFPSDHFPVKAELKLPLEK